MIWVSRSYLETKITINTIALILVGVILAGAFTMGAFSTGQWAWLIAVPMNVVGIALVLLGSRVRHRTEGSRGTAISTFGAVFIAGSIWAAFMLGNATAS